MNATRAAVSGGEMDGSYFGVSADRVVRARHRRHRRGVQLSAATRNHQGDIILLFVAELLDGADNCMEEGISPEGENGS
jgi:hypothetical protein